MFKKAQALIANRESNELTPKLFSNLLTKLPIVHQLRATLRAYSDRRSRRLSERAKKANRARYRRWLILGEPLEDRALLAGFTVSGSTLALNLTAVNESVSITSAGSTYAFVLSGGTWSGTNSADATGNGTATLTATAASFTGVTVDDDSTGNRVNFNSSSNAYSSSFSIVLDDATAGAITFNGNTAFTGSAALSASTSRNITFNNLATLITVSGDLTLLANQQAVPTDFADNGISVGPDVRLATTSGNITLKGRGGVVNGYSGVSMASYSGTTVVGGGTFTGNITIVGQGGGQSSNGLYMLRTFIATSGGNIDITGTGGTSTGLSDGIYMDVHSFIKTDGAGNLSVTGVGGTGSSANGIVIRGRTDAISAGTGTITLFGNASNATGTASTGISFQNTPPFQLPGGVISSGNIFITGIGAPGALGLELNSGCPITTTGGNISLIADSMSIVGTVNAAAGSVNLRNYSRARYIDLGSTTDGAASTLGLSNTELNNITANTLNIGDVGTAVINISTSIALNSVTNLNLIAGIINFNGNTISGATVNQIQGTFPYITVEQTAGTIIADGGTMAFGQVAQGSSRDLVFTIKNPGLADLTGLDITIDGTNAAEFSVVVSPTAPVAPGGSTAFTIRHAPVATGTKSAALHIASNVSGAINPYDINLTASSTADISVEQAGTVIADGGTQGFGGVSVGNTADLVFTVKNPGTGDLTISDITFDGANASEFSVFAAPTTSVPANGSTTFTVRYAPTTIGSKTAALHIASDVPGAKNPYDINLTASSTPDISVEQLAGTVIADGGTQGFGGVSVGSTADLVFTVKNPGTSGLTISDITFDGANASEFSVIAAPTTSVPASGSTTFTVRCAPTTIGSKTAALHIANNVPGAKNPYDINLTASSTPDISVEQASTIIADGGTQGFGGVLVGSTADLVFTVKNPGTSGLTISDITIDGANANEFSVIAAPTTSVPVSGSTTFTVRYSPTTIGNKTAALHIANNVPGAKNPYDINLTASSSPDISVEQAGTIIADGGTQGFGSISVGNTADLVFTVKNPGTSGLTISDITFDGASASEFSVIAAPTTSVPVSGSTTFTVRYAPVTVGTKTAALHIANNVPGAKNPYDVNLTAIAPWTGPMFGTVSVGPNGFYSSLTQVITDIQRVGLSGAVVIELQPTYVSTVETFPLTFSNLGTTAVNTLTVRPATGATNLLITSANTTAATVDLNGAQFVTIDGRPGGTGTAKELTIENTSTSGVAVRFINESSNNTLKFVTLRGVNTSATSGTVLFSTTTGTNGNDNNTIDTCDIRDGATTPTNGIYSLGTTTTSAQNNSGNTVSNSNIFNFYSSTTASSGVRLDSGNTDWTISGNSFYQIATRAATSSTVTPIFIDDVSGNNFTVTGNFIGGDSPSAAVTTQNWTTTGTAAAYLFQGIRLNVGATTASSVQGNTIANMVWTSSSNATALPGVWSGIYVTSGNVNIGTVTGNTIGSGTGTGSISVTTAGNGGTSFGIASSSSGTVAIAGNTIGSITVKHTATSAASLTGISVTAGANTITGNTVGSTTTANSLNAATSSLVLVGQQVTGILSSSSISASITGNTVANLNNNYGSSGSAGQIRGIVTSAGVNTITGNTVRNLSTTSRNVNTGMTATTGHSVVGIAAISTTAGQTVSQNTVHSLANTSTSAVNVTGIYYNGVSTGTNLIARNFVHSLAISSPSTGAVLNGMQFATGTFTAQNNMVRVGIMADGTSTASASTVRGIYDNGTTSGRNFYHNSVYVGGTQTSGASTTFAFGYNPGIGSPNFRDYRNNIFVNARSNSGGTGKHYAVNYAASAAFRSGLTANNNLFFVSGTGGVLGFFDGVDRTTLAAWQTALGGGSREANSLNADPLFVNPTGTAATLDLHLQSTSPAIGSAAMLAGVTNDFDGDSRTPPPTDIGADEFVAANTAPTALVLSPSSVILSENANTASAIELSTISITDDGVGTNALSLSGTDAASFEIVADKLRLKAGVALDFETKSSYTVRVNVDDTTVGSTPDAFADFTLNISDVNEAPTALSLLPTSAIFAENISTASAIELSTITFADDALGTNTLSLSGPDAASFEIVAGKLYLKAGAALDYETKTSLIVNVNVDDTAVGASPDASATFTLNLTNITELTGIDVQKGQSQRSFVRNVDILFDNDVGLTELLSGNRVKLTRMDLNGLNRTAMTLPTNAVSGRQIQLDFGAQGIGGNRNSNVGDGYFEIAIDMDGDGSFELIKNFFRLYGDVTGDGIVDSRDKAQVMSMSGTTNVEGDLNGDGVVNLTDTTAVSRAVGRKLKAGLTWDD